ncbi:MAG: hypothetical protein HDQ88_11845 [Clostridia bacterium]|nr:hypothetical protein [Clostridia bacterium]
MAIDFTIIMNTPETLLDAVNTAKRNGNLLASENGRIDNINMSSIYSKCINAAGRWCERFSSDLLIDVRTINEYMKTPSDEHEMRIFGIGFRESGVDHNAFLMARIKDTMDHATHYCYPERTYRKIYAVVVKKDHTELVAELYDITHDIYRIHEKDLTNDG